MKVSDRVLLFIENDRATRDEIMAHFAADNTVMVADCLFRAEECLKLFKYDMIIADADFRDGSPFELYKKHLGLPPLILYSHTRDDETIINWLDNGAIDYIIRPASIKLLEAKIAVRLPKKVSIERVSGGLVISPATKTVSYNGKPISLTSSEFNILDFLVKHEGQFFSSDELYEKIWNAKALNTVTIRKHISSLRRKLLAVTDGMELILTDFGKGYSFVGK